MATTKQDASHLITALLQEIQVAHKALLRARPSELEQHTDRLRELATELTPDDLRAAISLGRSEDLVELLRALRVYRSLLQRSNRYIHVLMNVLALCAHECSYGPNSWTVSALQA